MIKEKKSLAVQIIATLLLLIGAYSGSFNENVQAWLGIATMTLTVVLSTFAPSGVFVKGWNWIMWATNISGVVILVLIAMGDIGKVSVLVVNQIIIVINIFLQLFVKDYTKVPAQTA